jgi:hypothetical protein
METWSGITLSCAALLVLSGIPKLRHPAGTVNALRSIGVRRTGVAAARVLTTIELVVGCAAVVIGGRSSDWAVSVVYLGFSVFLIAALRKSAPSCGCTGRHDTPPTPAHLVMTAMFAIASAIAASYGGRTGLLAMARAAHPATSLTLLAYAGVVTWLGWALLNLAPRALGQQQN